MDNLMPRHAENDLEDWEDPEWEDWELEGWELELRMGASEEADLAENKWNCVEIRDNNDSGRMKRYREMRQNFNAKHKSLKRQLHRRTKRLVAASARDHSLSEPAAGSVIAYTRYIFYDHRLRALLRLIRDAPREVFWPAFLWVWPACGDALRGELLGDLLRLLGRNAPSHEFFLGEDRELFEALPPVVTIYRGCETDRRLGLSWSPRREVAALYPKQRYGLSWIQREESISGKTEIVTSQVKRSDIFAIYSAYDEIVIDSARLLKPPEATGAR
jgi:hypothetical protein